MFQTKKIDIQAHLVESFIDKYGDQSIQKFCNDMLEKFMNGLLVEIDPVQRDKITSAARQINVNPNEFLTQVLIRLEFDIQPIEKVRVAVDTQATKIKVRKLNPGTNY
jgi:uncharacterized protein YehS (DUF1456 family)